MLVPYLLCLFVFSSSVSAWGGLFNRFNPSLLNSFGGGGLGGYGKEIFNVAQKMPRDEAIKEEMELDVKDPCSGRKCTANEHCCDGNVCVDAEENMGICLPIWGKKQGEVCYRDNDCESGFVCLDSANGFRSCQAPIPGDAKLGEDCRTSSDCNINRGLCCKLQRRARSQPKKVCTYFMDPDTCIGPVATSQVLSAIEHTAGEKRISGHPDDFLRLK
ncbi:Prohormone-3,ITG-like peptide [Lepeophtheirus salmonis]|nr:Prohormone-3,ITG-like peptide [Lepeophtheirus salmonis]CAF2750219.1 Prohormone-3,ITG-like peptide [Lepeophtheirus salmonis]